MSSRGPEGAGGWLARERIAPVLGVIALVAASYLVALSGVYFAQYFAERGPAFVPLQTAQDGFFRWDALIYHDIATNGYRYDGDSCRTQNIVFMPVFPLAARYLAAVTPLDARKAGFVVVRLSFLIGCLVLFHAIAGERGAVAGLFVVLGLCFSPGSFAFHAYYSEGPMLLLLALAVWCYRKQHDVALAVVVALLGASRITAAPFAVAFAAGFLWKALQLVRTRTADQPLPVVPLLRQLGLAAVCVSGLAGYLLFIATRFGDPFEILPAIKYCAWNKVHKPMAWWELISFSPLFGHLRDAIARPTFFVLDFKATNLIWTLLAFGATLTTLVRRQWTPITLGFAGYFLLTFYANGKADFLESSYRYYAPMFTIYLALFDLWSWSSRRLPAAVAAMPFLGLLAVNVLYMAFYMTLFTAGRWHFF